MERDNIANLWLIIIETVLQPTSLLIHEQLDNISSLSNLIISSP